MIKSLIFLILAFFALSIQAQTINDTIKALYFEKKYDEVIGKVKNEKQLNASGFFYIGLCYYITQEDQKAYDYFSYALEKEPKNAQYAFYQGTALEYLKRFEESKVSFRKAISNDAKDPIYFIGLADAYYNLNQLDSAIIFYQSATKLEKCPPRAFLMIGQSFSELKKIDKAIDAYAFAKQKIDTTSEYYLHCLYDIGVLDYQEGRYFEADKTLNELLLIEKDNFNAIAKLIQVYYAEKKYDKAKPLRAKMYEAYQNKKLPENLSEMFCFDQFVWKNQRVSAFEKFEDKKDEKYYKHIFLLQDEKGSVKRTILTESSLAVQTEGKKYVLGSVENEIHHTYWQFLFDADFDYSKMKKAVVDILEHKAKPTSTSTISTDK